MRARMFLTALAALVLVPASAALPDATPASISVESPERMNCAIGWGSELCALEWDQGEDPDAIGDDQVNITHFFDRIEIIVRAPTAKEYRFAFKPAEFAIEHPMMHIANGTWLWVNDTLPEAAKEYVTFESRAFHTGDDENAPRGILLIYQSPVSVTDPVSGATSSRISLLSVSWECRNYLGSRDNWDEACSYDDLRPLPNGAAAVSSTDDDVRGAASTTDCMPLFTPTGADACATTDIADRLVDAGASDMTNVTPNIGFGAAVEEIVVNVTPLFAGERILWPEVEQELSNSSRATSEPVPEPAEVRVFAPSSTGWTGLVDRPHGLPGEPDADPPPPLHAQSFLPPILSPGSPLPTVALVAAGSLIALFAFVLYHRVIKPDALENKNRRLIHESIRLDPGIRAGSISKKLGLNYQTVQRHLRLLEEFHMIEGVGDGQRRYFLNGGSFSAKEKQEVLAASSPSAKATFELVRRNGTTELSQICAALDLSPSTVSETVSQLATAGLLVKERTNGRLLIALASRPGSSSPD